MATTKLEIKRGQRQLEQKRRNMVHDPSYVAPLRHASFGRIPEGLFSKSSVLSRNADDVTYICERCGIVEPHAYANGYIRRKCACEELEREATRIQQARALSVIHVEANTYTWLGKGNEVYGLEARTFDTFHPEHQADVAAFRQHLATAKLYASQVIHNRAQAGNALFVGTYGTGKTHLTAAILNALRANGINCLFCTAPKLFSCYYAASFEQKEKMEARLSTTQLLVVDDLDSVYVTRSDDNYQQKLLYIILDARSTNHLPTIITTNEQNDLGKWLDGKTRSRLFERVTVLAMNGADYRTLGRA